ncbi:hypothetical protein SSCG_03115 [Streptomyces clavuligerus]|nr:hypothetical protein SSCG_03115 [Streptomyces clavuligerus]
MQGGGGGDIEVGHAATLIPSGPTAAPWRSVGFRGRGPPRSGVAHRGDTPPHTRAIPPENPVLSSGIPSLRGVGRRVGHPPRATPNSVQ